MVARLELAKEKTNKDFSTNVTSEPQDALSSGVSVVPPQHTDPEIEEAPRDVDGIIE